MRNFRLISGQVLAVAASMVLLTACGGGGDDAPATTTTTTVAGATTTTRAGTTTTTVAGTTTTTQAGTVTANAVMFANTRSGMCLREGTGADAGKVVESVNCFPNGGDAAGYWKVTKYADGVTLSNTSTNKCMAIAGASTTTGAFAVTQACDGSKNTKWTMPASGGTAGNVNLVNANSTQCLEIASANDHEGGQASQWTCGTTQPQANQTWATTTVTP